MSKIRRLASTILITFQQESKDIINFNINHYLEKKIQN